MSIDGEEIHASTSRSGIFQFAFRIRRGPHMELICHASPSLAPNVGFRQYDLKVNGQSFHSLMKMYEIGTRGYFPRSLAVVQMPAPPPQPAPVYDYPDTYSVPSRKVCMFIVLKYIFLIGLFVLVE